MAYVRPRCQPLWEGAASFIEDRLAQVFLMQTAMTPDEEYATTLLGLTEMVMTGTTTLVDPGTTRFPDAVMAAYEAVGCRVMTGEHVTDRENPVNLPVYETGSLPALTAL